MRGAFWLVLGAATIVTIVVLAYVLIPEADVWCDIYLNAGDCNPLNDTCYCIDQKTNQINQSIGIYEHSQTQCKILNGTLAAPDEIDVLLWLSKRMFDIGVDRAYIGLHKMNSDWFWMKENGSTKATEINWRADFPPEPQENHAVITVETLEIDNMDDGYIYYNYDHYIEKDRNYQWWGFTTASNIYAPTHYRNVYYICHYVNEPPESLIQQPTTAAPSFAAKTGQQNQDPCFCSNNKQIKLLNLKDSETFTSPGYPTNYCSDSNCRWIVTTRKDLVLRVEWVVFSTENQFDMVYIYDGDMGDDPLIATCTGSRCPNEQSSAHEIQIHFSSDHVTTDIGFKGKVTAIEPDSCYCSKSLEITLANVGDSFAFKSPNYPAPYCVNQHCSWLIQGPDNNGLHLVINGFDLENTDFLSVFDSDHMLRNCSSTDCAPVVSISSTLHISFASDDHQSSHKGFSGVVTSVPNCNLTINTLNDDEILFFEDCLKESLVDPHGTASFSDERSDGNVPIGATGVLSCNKGSKIKGTIKIMKQSLTCTELGWSDTLPTCVPVCELESEELSGEVLNVCKVGQVADMNLVSESHNVTLTKYNNDGSPLMTQLYSCDQGGTWNPKKPICHVSKAILIVGGGMTIQHEPELYSPIEFTTRIMSIANLVPRMQHISVILPDGRILVAGGYRTENDLILSTHTDLIDIKKLESVSGPPMVDLRQSPGAALLDQKVFVCGGFSPSYGNGNWDNSTVYSSCEVLENDQWKIETRMPIQRYEFALVALNGCLYAIAGRTSTERLRSVHRFCPEQSDQWASVAPLIIARDHMDAAVVGEFIYACGGIVDGNDPNWSFGTDSCEKYDIEANKWMMHSVMQMQRAGLCMTSFDGIMFALGGAYLKNTDQAVTAEKYENGEWKENIRLINDREYSAVVVVPLMDWG